MSSRNLFGTSRTIPEDGATNWGADVRVLLEDICEALDNMATMTTAELPFLVLKGAATSVGTGTFTLTPTSNRHDVTSSSGGDNEIDVIAIVDGAGASYKDGQTLLIVGQDDTATVTMLSDSPATTKYIINGDITLGANDAIFLSYDASATRWIEISRNT